MDRVLGILISVGLLAAVFLPLQRLFPARPMKRWLGPRWTTDAAFFFGQYLLWGGLVLAALSWVKPMVGQLLPVALTDAFASQPPWLQCAEAVVLGDLVIYWGHRWSHSVDLLWRFHSVHHAAEHVDWLASHREHPVDSVFTQLLVNLPAFLLGLPMEWLAPVIAFRGLWGVFIHSNVSLPLGPLGWLLGAPELHRWHHRRSHSSHNFANLAPYWDWVFGTYFRPRGQEDWALGVMEPYPQTYLGQLLHPFRRGTAHLRVDPARLVDPPTR